MAAVFGSALGLAGCQNSTPRHCPGPLEIDSAQALAAASACDVIDGDLRIVDSTLTGLAGLEHVRRARYVVVGGNRDLRSLSGLSGLLSAEGMTVQYNRSLTDLSGLEHLHQVDGLVVLSNMSLESLHGLEGLRHAREIVVADNPVLDHARAIAGLTHIDHFEVQFAKPSELAAERSALEQTADDASSKTRRSGSAQSEK